MNILCRMSLVMAILVMTVVASAQGGMRMMGGPGGGGKLMILRRDDVKAELKLTTTQKDKIEVLFEKMQEDMRDMFQGGGGGGDMEDMRKEIKKMTDGVEKEVLKLLEPGQIKRLQEVNIQLAGNAAILQPDIAKEVGITAEQDAKIKAIQAKQMEEMQGLMEKMRNGEIERTEIQDMMKKRQKDLDTKLGEVLTDAQKLKLKEMGGVKFTPKDDRGG